MENAVPSFDLAIIGGGPAGAAAAITAARLGAMVAIFEAGKFPRQKVCGEFVSAESLNLLRHLWRDSSEAERVIQRAPIVDTVRLFLGGRTIRSSFSPPALSIPRFDLDRLLWDAAKQAGAQTYSNCEVRNIAGDGPFVLDTANHSVSARAVIMAAGRWSRFRPDTPVPDGPKWIGVKAHFRESACTNSTDLYFFDYGYCGVQPVANDVVNTCAMVRSDRAKTLPAVLALHTALVERSRNWKLLTEPVATAPLVFRKPEPVRGNIIFVGDAAAFVDPFVGDGISLALRSGSLAARVVIVKLQHGSPVSSAIRAYERSYLENFEPIMRTASRIRMLLNAPIALRTLVFSLSRVPGVIPHLIRRTR